MYNVWQRTDKRYTNDSVFCTALQLLQMLGVVIYTDTKLM